MAATTSFDTGPRTRRTALALPQLALPAGLTRLADELRRRRQLASLASLDDRTLRDIGLTRAEIREAVSRPFGEDSVCTAIHLSARRRARGD